MTIFKKVAHISSRCVSCGNCIKACPTKALSIYKGITAVVDENKCVGCGRCANACPAQVIVIKERGGSE